jgi:hypothetical protein
MANATTSFILGVLTVLVIGGAIYIYRDFTKSETKVANYSANDTNADTYIYDKDDKVMENAIDESINNNLDSDSVATQKGTINGTLCYPSDFIPKGELVAKNTATAEITKVTIDGTTNVYKIQVDPGTYNLRYQAHADNNNPNSFLSGYYTKCSINSDASVCNAADGHTLIPITVSGGDVKSDIKVCDFYYTDEPDF